MRQHFSGVARSGDPARLCGRHRARAAVGLAAAGGLEAGRARIRGLVQGRGAVIRVGFEFSFDDGWLGGVNYFRNLLTALYALPERKIEAVIFTGLQSTGKHFDGFPAIKIVRSRMFDKGTIIRRIRHIVRYRLKRDFLFEWLLKINGISVLSHSDWLPVKCTSSRHRLDPGFSACPFARIF